MPVTPQQFLLKGSFFWSLSHDRRLLSVLLGMTGSAHGREGDGQEYNKGEKGNGW